MRVLGSLAAFLFSLTLAACANDPVREGAFFHQMARPMETGSIPINIAADRDLTYQYRLGPSDKVRVITFDEPSLTGEFVVSGSGTISLPLVGDIRAAGLTTADLSVQIQNALKDGYLTDPKVSVEVLNYRPFYIMGEVGRPGEYPFVIGLTVLNAVATANGFTYRANTHRVIIRRGDAASEREIDLTTTTPVWPGDTIRIKERLF